MQNKIYFICLIVAFASCKPKIDAPDLSAGSADLEKPIYFGDNYLTGFQNGALYFEGQNKSLAALINSQFEKVNAGGISQPYLPTGCSVGPNSKPWDSPFVERSYLKYKTDCKNVESLSPIKQLLSEPEASTLLTGDYFLNPSNISIPFANSEELLNATTGNDYQSGGNPFYHYYASSPGVSSPLDDAKSLNGSFSVVWMGMENIFRYARNGGKGVTIPTSASFEADLDIVLSQLATNEGQGVIANIPDFRSLPYYTTIPYNGANLTLAKADSINDIFHNSGFAHINFTEGDNAFIFADSDAPMGVRHLEEDEYITISVPTDSMKCNFMGIAFHLLPDQYSLNNIEVEHIDDMISEYNDIIESKATEYEIAFVDVHSYFKNLETGFVWNGIDFNASFISGGFFSLDGVHPHQKGYSLLADEFIKSINEHYGSVIPTVYCPDCESVRFP